MASELSPEELEAVTKATTELFGSFETPHSKRNEEPIAEPGRYQAEDVANMPDEDEEEPELIADWLPASGMVEIYGAPKAGKSWLGLDWALHVATGRNWHGAKVQQARVLYLIGEGRREIRKRVRAWYKANGVERKPGQISFVYRPFSLGVEAIKGLRADNPGLFEGPNRVRLIFVDTVNRFMAGNENDTRDTSDFVKACDVLRGEDCLVVLHHTGRTTRLGPAALMS